LNVLKSGEHQLRRVGIERMGIERRRMVKLL
jgi:hypothetical protein